MKKLLLLPLLACSSLFALPLGNPMDASLYCNGLVCDGFDYDSSCCDPCDTCFSWCDAWSFRLGFYGDYVFDRHMELKNRSQPNIDDFEIYTNAAFLALNVCNRIDLFATLGATDYHLEANSTVFGFGLATDLSLDTETAFSWSIGGRWTIWSCDCFYLGLEGQYFCSKNDVERIVLDDNTLFYPDKFIEMKYSEWQVGLGASYMYRIGCSGFAMIPYLGVKWAGSCADFGNGEPNRTSFSGLTLFDLESQKLWGFAVGTTLLACDAATFTVEGRFGDEKALHVNGQFRF